jgi:hypothetical protein
MVTRRGNEKGFSDHTWLGKKMTERVFATKQLGEKGDEKSSSIHVAGRREREKFFLVKTLGKEVNEKFWWPHSSERR